MANHLIFFESTIRPHFAKHAGDFWAKKLARNLTDTLISRPPDYATIGRNNMLWPWALVSPIKLSDGDKLEILQRLDQFRQWRSLDEKRYCLVCGKMVEQHAQFQRQEHV